MKRYSLIVIVMALLYAVTAAAQGSPAASLLTGNLSEATYSPVATQFKIETLPGAKAVKLRLYNEGMGGKPIKTVNLKHSPTAGGNLLWEGTVKGDLKGKFYTFDVKYGKAFKGETPGVFATAVGVNGRRGAIIDMRDTDPAGWSSDRRPAIAPKDLILYELHHRDFSIDASSGLQHKGKFLALTEPRAIAHLKRLGINAVHILPSFDYASIDETNLQVNKYNWGYDPLNYNVPEGSYSTDPYNPVARISEFKQMVQALHRAGIQVILDVVYNHTYSVAGSPFQCTMPDEYFRLNADGTYSNGSGCGNETASEHEVMRRFMVESVKYWVSEYHIDGFRFDLMGVHDIETMNTIRTALNAIDPDIYVYGEGWSAGTCAYPHDRLAMKAAVDRMPGIAAFSDDIRDALRGPFSDDTKPAFLAGIKGHEQSIMFGIVGGVSHPQVNIGKVNYSDHFWCNEPTQLISYVSCHDDMCLVDRLKASIPGIGIDELIRLDLLAQTAVFTSQGVPFMLSGEEMLRDKKGVHNSFESPDSINHLDWTNLEKYPQVMAYYSELINIRKQHPAFHMGSAELVRRNLEFLPAGDCVVAFHIKSGLRAQGVNESWGDIYVVLNANKQATTITVPEGDYTVVARNIAACEQGLATISGSTVTVPAQSALIFHN